MTLLQRGRKEESGMSDLRSILVFSEDPKRLGDFYGKVFRKDPDWVMEGYYGAVSY